MDIDKITIQIKEILKKFDSETNLKQIQPTSEILYNKLEPFLNYTIHNILIENTNYWNDTGIRIESTEEYVKCFNQLQHKEVGRGAFGTVYKVHVHKCIQNIPKNVNTVAIKVEKLDNYYFFNHAQLKNSILIIKKAAKLGITPELYDVFIVKVNDKYLLIKVFQYIEGQTWNTTKFTKQSYEKALQQLNQAIHLMNTNGIIHHDIHLENVMVSKDKVYLIDFDLAHFAKEDEKNEIKMFYKPEYTMNKNVMRSIFVFNELFKKKVNKTRKNISKKHEYKKKK
jgi:tRNA A-37 threonylcarbamoyl transferase component Bud32